MPAMRNDKNARRALALLLALLLCAAPCALAEDMEIMEWAPKATETPAPTEAWAESPSPYSGSSIASKSDPKYYNASEWGMYVASIAGYSNDVGEDVYFCLGMYAEFSEDIGKPEVLSVSWMDVGQYQAIDSYFYSNGTYADYLDEMLKSAKESRMLYSSEYVVDADGPRWYFDMAIPDDPTIAGAQSITIKMKDQMITYSGYLTYEGDYSTGTGWASNEWTITEISEAE